MHLDGFKYERKVVVTTKEKVIKDGASTDASSKQLADQPKTGKEDIKETVSVTTSVVNPAPTVPKRTKEEFLSKVPILATPPLSKLKDSSKKEKVSEKKTRSVTRPTVPEKPKDILELNKELRMALYGTELINQAGIMLQLTQMAIATAQSFYHRFFRGLRRKRRSYKQYPPFLVAMTCVYLSSKVEEEKRRHRDVLNVFDRLQKKNAKKPLNVLDPYGRRYSKWKLFMMKLELIILCDLGYQLKLQSPHKFILNYISVLEADEKVAQKAWSYLNDSLRLPSIIEIRPEVLACAAIYLAAKYFQVSLPKDPPWHKLFDATREEIEYVSRMIMELYKIPQSCFQLQESDHIQDPDKGSELLDRFKLPVPPKKKKKVKKSKTRTKDKEDGASGKSSPTAKKKSKYNHSSSETRPRSSKKKRESPRLSKSRSRSRRPSNSRSASRSGRKSSKRHKKSRRKRREREGSDVKKTSVPREKRRRSRSRSRERRKRRRRVYSSD